MLAKPTKTGLFCAKRKCDSLSGSYLISTLITATYSNLNEESRVSHERTLVSRRVAFMSNIATNKRLYALIEVILVIKVQIR